MRFPANAVQLSVLVAERIRSCTPIYATAFAHITIFILKFCKFVNRMSHTRNQMQGGSGSFKFAY